MSILLETIIYLLAVFGIIIATYSMITFDCYYKPHYVSKKTLKDSNNKTSKSIDIYTNDLNEDEEKDLIKVLDKTKLINNKDVNINIYKI